MKHLMASKKVVFS